MLARPAGGFGHVARIARGHQDLREQRVRVKGDRSEHCLKLPLRERATPHVRSFGLGRGREQGQDPNHQPAE
jgi:hypothetical protein